MASRRNNASVKIFVPPVRHIWLIPLTCLCLLTACAGKLTPSPSARARAADSLAQAAGWKTADLKAGAFSLRTYSGVKPMRDGLLTVYIEGDGHAWQNTGTPSDDPTPVTPMALQLALKQPWGAVAVVSRPCQYIGIPDNPLCKTPAWTDRRYDVQVLESVNQAIEQLKRQSGAKQVRLIGYSGGAAIALILAANRRDVEGIVAVAGNVDPVAWAKHHALSPLLGSMDTNAAITDTAAIPQIYYVGSDDPIVPPILAHNFAMRFPAGHRPKVMTINKMSHVCCWADQWPSLWRDANRYIEEAR